ncbi:hypothetical protein GNI_063760 [Gregarina niphandrodes]|uniref:Uncharacterized protein n=1 Tax=Gregarina niphandrodes TaxID=110365 RepID=A0A023B816_GRENI|nr:hypothetical protein GNI_063760 [Gregarina niphandrodes]EZG68156.1 hypothetical protein GNI_063760 [Gregarina niphandrodes]|eukprot:XP_011130050.1 hypothetical protein GNI_063760 [Gregarina niphandrodes]
MIMEYFEAQGNKLKPCSMEVDEIVDEIATVGLIPDSDKLLVTQMVIDYLLEEIRPAPNDEFRRVKDAKGKLRRHISDLAAAARYEVLSSGVVPEDISTLGVPFVISRKPQAPSLPLGPLMWAYDILRYDLLHVLPAGYIRSMRRIPSVVELARYAASKLPKPGHQTNPLYCYPHELYNNITEVTDFRSWVDDTIACRLQSRETETRLLCLPTQHDIRNTIKMKWAEHLLRSCWDKAGQSKDGVSKPVFLAMVFSHVCEVMRSE